MTEGTLLKTIEELIKENQELKQAVKFLEDTLVLSIETEKGTAISLDGHEISIEGYWLVQGNNKKIYLIYPKDYEILKKYLKSIGGE